MDLKALQSHVDTRFDKLETKLDDYATQTVRNTQDLTWLKTSGSIVLTLVLIPALLWLATQYFTIHK